MLSLRERLVVVNLNEGLGNYRAVAALVGCDHKTVKARLERERDGRSVKQRPRATDPYLPLIRAKVAATQGKIKGKPLLRVLRAAGYTASLRVLQRALFEARQEWSREHRRINRPWVSAPGEFLVVDWGDVGTISTAAGERKLLCFCAVLGWSRWKYVRFFTAQRFAVLAQGLAACFETLGGTPANVLFDNPKTVTVGFVAGASVLNPQLVRLVSHYRFNPATAAPNDPETKQSGGVGQVRQSKPATESDGSARVFPIGSAAGTHRMRRSLRERSTPSAASWRPGSSAGLPHAAPHARAAARGFRLRAEGDRRFCRPSIAAVHEPPTRSTDASTTSVCIPALGLDAPPP
jgi:transposase